MKEYCGIYKITSPTGKIYIGQSYNFLVRLNAYSKNRCKKQRKLYASLQKHGFENHTFEFIHSCCEIGLDFWEIYYVNFYNTFNTPHGMNLTRGGNPAGRPDEKTKEKSRLSHLGQKLTPCQYEKMCIANKKAWTLERRKEKSEKMKGDANHFFGKKHNNETNTKISIANKGKKWTQEQRLELSKLQILGWTDEKREKQSIRYRGDKNPFYGKKRNPVDIQNNIDKLAKKILQFDLDGNFIKEWPTIASAGRFYNVDFSVISCCLRGISKTSCGFKWKYKEVVKELNVA